MRFSLSDGHLNKPRFYFLNHILRGGLAIFVQNLGVVDMPNDSVLLAVDDLIRDACVVWV
jgi:hypothetical protein